MTGTGHVEREVIYLFRAVKDAAGSSADLDLQAWETQIEPGVRYKVTGRLNGRVLVLPAMDYEEMVAALKGMLATLQCIPAPKPAGMTEGAFRIFRELVGV